MTRSRTRAILQAKVPAQVAEEEFKKCTEEGRSKEEEEEDSDTEEFLPPLRHLCWGVVGQSHRLVLSCTSLSYSGFERDSSIHGSLLSPSSMVVKVPEAVKPQGEAINRGQEHTEESLFELDDPDVTRGVLSRSLFEAKAGCPMATRTIELLEQGIGTYWVEREFDVIEVGY
ncbi:hypothetical protein U1Q18_005091 [Sarracenia purpurea var. burkii]